MAHCRLDAAAAATVHHARAFAKGLVKGSSGASLRASSGARQSEFPHHVFGDHAAVVPRQHANALFVQLGERLARCATHHEAPPPAFAEPESFIHHALLELGVASASAMWLAPPVVATDAGRTREWCERYWKYGAFEVLPHDEPAPRPKNEKWKSERCAETLLSESAWTVGPFADLRAASQPCPAAPGSNCKRGSACCERHPRMRSCQPL